MTRLTWYLLVASSCLLGADGTVALDVRDYFGNPVSECEIQIEGRETLRVRRSQSPAIRLPYGRYEITIRASGFNSVKVEAVLDRPVLRIPVAMPIGSVGTATGRELRPVISGQVDPPGAAGEDVRVRIAAVYGNVSVTAYPDAQGRFKAVLEDGGSQLIALFVNGKLCEAKAISVRYDTKPVRLSCKQPQ